jgi:hypothetical protein
MPRFHLHIRNQDGLVRDEEGLDLPNLNAAREEARQAIREIVAGHIISGEGVRSEAWRSATRRGTMLLR